MQIRRIKNRSIFFIQKKILTILSYGNHRVFMKYYIPLLKKNGMSISGTPRYIGKDVIFDDFNKIILGDRVVISNDCHFLTHDYSYTTALIASGQIPKTDIAIVRGITIGSNVFIGKKSIIMPNTNVGNNVIIGAGSVVRGTIPDNSVVAGNPSTIVCTITELMNKWNKTIENDELRSDKS